MEVSAVGAREGWEETASLGEGPRGTHSQHGCTVTPKRSDVQRSCGGEAGRSGGGEHGTAGIPTPPLPPVPFPAANELHTWRQLNVLRVAWKKRAQAAAAAPRERQEWHYGATFDDLSFPHGASIALIAANAGYNPVPARVNNSE